MTEEQKDKARKRSSKYYYANKGRVRESTKRWWNNLSDEEKKLRKKVKKEYNKNYRATHPDTRTDRRDFAYRFGLTEDQYRERREKQRQEGDLCGVCKLPLPKDSAAHLDHDHETGQLREFTHKECNMAIGLLKDNPEICRKAAEYLEKYKRRSDGI